MRQLWLLAILLSSAFVSSAQNCPPNTFTCKDGSCIPTDWVGDGEPDCDDGSDEQSSKGTAAKEEDPFDEIVTLPPHGGPIQGGEPTIPPRPQSNKPTKSSNETDDCQYEHQLRIDECSEPILLFIHEVNAIYFENSSFLADKEVQSRIEKGCDLMHEYQICVEGASTACKPDEGVMAWREVEMYICQLLIPAIREHEQCFSKGRDKQCNIKFDPLASPFCRLVTSVSQDVDCIQSFNKDCSDAALEMLPPIQEESQHIVDAIRCRQGAAITSTSTPEEVEEEEEEEEVEEGVTKQPTTTMTKTLATEMMVEGEGEVTTTEKAKTNTDANAPNRDLKLNISEAVNALYYIYDVCSADYSKSPYKVIVDKICTRQDDIAKHSDCYQSTLEKMKCATRDAKTECDALDSFNSNLDCAVVTMNDACEVAAQNFVIDLQESVNDILIEKKCFSEKKEGVSKQKEVEGEFVLHSTLPHCSDEQIATPNSTAVQKICDLYGKYESCLSVSVFKGEGRCAFASPLNSLARIGLAPICSLDSRPLLAQHRDCLLKLAEQTSQQTNCQGGLASLGNTVNMMLQGIHAEALLCKSFYLIKETFSCGEKAVQEQCDAKALEDLGKLKTQMTALGEEEGCPASQPANLDEIIARPVKKPQPMGLPTGAPKARPIVTPAPLPPPPQARPVSIQCSPEQHKKFEGCVQPLTAFQPHPLSVIKMPRQIDEACAEFSKFKECISSIGCHPLWAKGMQAMFEYACGEGAVGYKEVRQCLRRTATQDNVAECVAQFSRGAPTQACLSANKLLSCSLAAIQTECGNDGANWVQSYVTKFATAIDPRCKLTSQLPIGKVVGIGCSPEEEAIIEHCAAPLNDIGSRMEELFQGGLQSMIKNVNSLAPVFAGGCNLTDEFRTCGKFLLSGRSGCVVSSCMLQAGDGICNQPDPAKAIDTHLSCVFGQIQEPTFAKCVRSTLSTVKQFTLASFRNILPKFVDCTEELVLAKCGPAPIQVLRAISSPDVCPVSPSAIVPINGPTRVEPNPPVCTEEKRTAYKQCTQSFYSKYRMLPVSLLNELDNMDQVCQDISTMDGCSLSTRICATPQEIALKRMVNHLCATRGAFEKHKICYKTLVSSSNGTHCMSEFMTASPPDFCKALKSSADCMAAQLQQSCGEMGLEYSYKVMQNYAADVDPDCFVNPPSVALETGCSEDDMLEFLECESRLDAFSFRPIAIIGDFSRIGEFCDLFSKEYRPCIQAMKCRFEPVSSANMKILEEICEKPVTKKEYGKYGKCLVDYSNSPSGRSCIEKMADVDPVARDAPAKMCTTLNEILGCASHEVEQKCGYDALLHIYDTHIQWATSYNATCLIASPEPKSVPSNTLDESRDVTPSTVILDETTPPTTPTSPPTTPLHPKALPTTPGYTREASSALLTASTLCFLLLRVL